ncbi:hypothetical protein ABER99_21510 [Paenibacillus glucanolyticus]|jgi:hypothetical protein|uniref:Uncharacterized protein n=1 Tax=Paenibacillus glucanolyticus TaxID=59843 RepID=A0A163GUV6_9BACL|nr:hypothetical protein [Paenibacillus glucanolyticus]KZS45166.1 hypothetical protein AWU65_04070 [Paenibacillus glucanolyticus]OMF63869.1 hypothetical protein BK142_32445 [Paenibacillus glucanolyticus]
MEITRKEPDDLIELLFVNDAIIYVEQDTHKICCVIIFVYLYKWKGWQAMVASPTAMISLITVLAIILLSFINQIKHNKQEPLIVYFTQKLILFSLSYLVLAAIWFVSIVLLGQISLFVSIGLGSMITAAFVYILIRKWNKMEQYVSKFVKQAYNRG